MREEVRIKILVAVDTFKGTVSSVDIGKTIKGQLSDHDVDYLSVSDGGEGIVSALEGQLKGQRVYTKIHDPLFRQIEAYYYLTEDQTAVVESALACGLDLVKGEENPLKTTTYGVGQLIVHALENGVKKFIVGIGGSSTNDGGIGMLEALGVKFFDHDHKIMKRLRGIQLKDIAGFDVSHLNSLIEGAEITVACDVDNPLLGKKGATYTFGPQKGGDASMCKILEAGMGHYAGLVEEVFGFSNRHLSGAGAAGGLGFCFVSFLNAKLQSGLDLVLDALKFDDLVSNYELVITGEGKIDEQTLHGKVPIGVLERASRKHVEVIAICGICQEVVEEFSKIFSIVPGICDLSTSLDQPMIYLSLLIDEVNAWLHTRR